MEIDDARWKIEQFQRLANEFFFTVSTQTLNDCFSTFSSLFNDAELSDFVYALSYAQAVLLLDRDDTEVLTNTLINLLGSESASTASLAAALLPRCMGLLAVDQRDDVVSDICSALEVFLQARQSRPSVALILALASTPHVLEKELQLAHLRSLAVLLKASTADFQGDREEKVVQALAAQAAFTIASSVAFYDFFRADDTSIIETALYEYLRAIRKSSGFVLNQLLRLLTLNPIQQAFLRVPHFLCVLFGRLGSILFMHGSRVRAVFASFLLLDAFLSHSAEDECRETVTLLRRHYLAKKDLQALVYRRFDQYCANYSVPTRIVQRIKFT